MVPERAGAALTKPGRVSTARWCGPGKRDGEEYARNRRRYVLDFDTGSNLVDMGRARCVPLSTVAEGTLERFQFARSGGHGEGLRRTHGEAVGTQPGSYFDERNMVNAGTT